MNMSDAMTLLFIGAGLMCFIAGLHAGALGAPLAKLYGLFAAGVVWLIIGFLRMLTINVLGH